MSPRVPSLPKVTFSMVLLAVAIGACAQEGTERGVLQAEDLSPSPEIFDKNAIVDKESLEDFRGISVADLNQFFDRTLYGRSSFLGTYQSNGIQAVDAILRAAALYRLNPIAFLVASQVTQGLVGEQFYPSPPARVEYAFRCGCFDGRCDPLYAGFDRQIECYGSQLRDYLDQIEASGETAGGWAPDKERTTLDGVRVRPFDASTAALYQYSPIVGEGERGNWLFWNLWSKYADAFGYQGPLEGTNRSWIGDACKGDEGCNYDNGICDTSFPGGVCTLACTGACPSRKGKPATFCAELADGGYCLEQCNPSAPVCREGLKCVQKKKLSAPDQAFVCDKAS